jgi:Domain of unknown function (DUF4395)
MPIPTNPPAAPPIADTWVERLVCPISAERVNPDVVRVTALIIACAAGAYLFTRERWIVLVLLADFSLRGFGFRAWSPLARVSAALVSLTSRKSLPVDFAPKEFAARIGWLVSLLIVIAHGLVPFLAVAGAVVLVVFALLESLAGFCVGCLIYSSAVYPFVRGRRQRA